MEVNDKLLFEISDLVIQGCDNALCDEEFKRLQNLLRNNPLAVKYYCDLLSIYANMDVIKELGFDSTSENLDGLLRQIAEDEKTAPAIKMPKEKHEPELIQKIVDPLREKRKTSKFQIFTFIISAAAVLFLVLFLKIVPEPAPSVEVATLVDQMNVKWADPAVVLTKGSRLSTGNRPLNLSKGLVSIAYDEGVDVVIEGPALFKIDQSGVLLEYGRLYGQVSAAGLGFTVRTTTSQFVDMGTEFGVQADVNGSSELHVIKGKVQLFAGSNGQSRTTQMVTENKAVRYDANSDQIRTIEVQEKAFVRKINSAANLAWKGQQFNLADVVGGGNGFGTGTLNKGIDMTAVCFKMFDSGQVQFLQSDDFTYRPFNGHPYIDGVTIANGQSGSVQVSSQGHRFKNCPPTNGAFWCGVMNGAWLKFPAEDVPTHRMTLDGKEYGTSSNPAIYITPNQAVTFDLDAIRNGMAGTRIQSFTAKAGLSHTLLDYDGCTWENGKVVSPRASFYVLVDGVARFEGIDRTPADDVLDIRVDLLPSERFLTIMVTQGTDGDINYDWTLFAEPFLHLQ